MKCSNKYSKIKITWRIRSSLNEAQKLRENKRAEAKAKAGQRKNK